MLVAILGHGAQEACQPSLCSFSYKLLKILKYMLAKRVYPFFWKKKLLTVQHLVILLKLF